MSWKRKLMIYFQLGGSIKETVSQSDIEQLASDAEELDKLGVSYAYVEKLHIK